METVQTHSKRGHGQGHGQGMWAMVFAALSLSLSACNHSNSQTTNNYCNSTGCYECQGQVCTLVPTTPSTPPATACSSDSTCGSGDVCNLGTCQTGCTADSGCASGYSCLNGRCRPSGSPQCGVAGAFCVSDAQCGASAKCVSGGCAQACPTGTCALGQACVSGACVDNPAPQMAQCQYNYDCNSGKGGFQCINSYCLPTCSTTTDCASTGGLTCVLGVCRADRRAAG